MTYMEKAAHAVAESSVAVMVLLSRDNTDAEFVALKPREAAFTSPEEFTARMLRPVGVIGLQGTQPWCAFKEPLGSPVVNSLATAFLEYIHVLLGQGQGFAEQMEAVEIAELERVWSIADTRPN
jgi:hypothetical protein